MLGLLLMLLVLLVPLLGGIWLINAVVPPPSVHKPRAAVATQEQLFQQELLALQRDYLQSMQALEHEARMTRAERSAVMDRMHDYHNHNR